MCSIRAPPPGAGSMATPQMPHHRTIRSKHLKCRQQHHLHHTLHVNAQQQAATHNYSKSKPERLSPSFFYFCIAITYQQQHQSPHFLPLFFFIFSFYFFTPLKKIIGSKSYPQKQAAQRHRQQKNLRHTLKKCPATHNSKQTQKALSLHFLPLCCHYINTTSIPLPLLFTSFPLFIFHFIFFTDGTTQENQTPTHTQLASNTQGNGSDPHYARQRTKDVGRLWKLPYTHNQSLIFTVRNPKKKEVLNR